MAKAATTTRKPRTSKAPEGETKAGKFSRLATARVNAALKKISLIGNLSGAGYEFTDAQVGKITTLLNDRVKATMAKFVKGATTAVDEIKI